MTHIGDIRMPYGARRILFVFAHHLGDGAALQKDIQYYEQIVRQTAILEFPSPEYYVLVVSPRISAHLLCTPEIQDYVRRNTEEGLKQLEQIGAALCVPPGRRCFAEGNSNLETWRISNALNIDKVYGYSKGFERFLSSWEAVRFGWQRFFNRPSWSRASKRGKRKCNSKRRQRE